jgi:hypothetical protein
MKKRYNLFIFIVLFPFSVFSNIPDFGFTKQKNIKKAYFVNTDATLDVTNSYGNIDISTWDEDKIELDIMIKVSGDSENWVNKRINDIDVDIVALKNLITAKTIIGNSGSYSNRHNNSFEINYTLKIPKNGNIIINNRYGNIFSSDINGNAIIKCNYGTLVLGKLNGNRTDIDIDYCTNSTIKFIKNATLSGNYSELKINEVGRLNLDSNYIDLIVDESQNINYSGNYGKLKLPKVTVLNISGNYLTLNIGEIFNTLNLETNYSKIVIGTVNEKANDISIDCGYSGLSMGYSANYAFDFSIALRYGGFDNNSNLEMYNKEEVRNSKNYQGFNKKRGVNKVTINSNYGNVSLTKKQ